MSGNTTCPASDAACNGPNAKEELYALAVRLERENCKLKEELEINTQEIDSYGVPCSNFRICSYCEAESGAGMLDTGIPHEVDCILANSAGKAELAAFAEMERRRLSAAITAYLELGGLFNPECMEHDKVRDLLIACREWMDSPEVIECMHNAERQRPDGAGRTP